MGCSVNTFQISCIYFSLIDPSVIEMKSVSKTGDYHIMYFACLLLEAGEFEMGRPWTVPVPLSSLHLCTRSCRLCGRPWPWCLPPRAELSTTGRPCGQRVLHLHRPLPSPQYSDLRIPTPLPSNSPDHFCDSVRLLGHPRGHPSRHPH